MVPSILEKIVATKRLEIAAAESRVPVAELERRARDAAPPRDFAGAIRQHPGISLIAEVKKASPSKGVIRDDFQPLEIARAYAAAGAQCISVLTDESYFQGNLDYLRQIRDAMDVPLLRKDFILDEYQVIEARSAGADAILLIAECLTPDRLRALHQCILQWQMTPLVEFYQARHLETVLECQPVLVGVNNRDLNTFEVDLQHSIRMRQQVPKEILFVSESGISSPEQVRQLESDGVDAILVGESLMRQADIVQGTRQLLGLVRST